MAEPRALLVSMPWAALGEPSLGLAILKACLDRAGIATRVRHCNLFLLRYLRASTYVSLANAYALNDFMFTYDFESEVSGVQYRIVRERVMELLALDILDHGKDLDEVTEKFITARRTIFPAWLEECATFIAAQQPTLVGLTCLFDQTIASVAVARRIRERLPTATIVLGGYAVEGPVAQEILRCFPWVDAVCLGEGEPAIVDLAYASVGRMNLAGIPNVMTRGDAPPPTVTALPLGSRNVLARRVPLRRASSVDLDSVPVPNFDDYFADLQELRTVDRVEIMVDTLPVESSRGCWWGQSNHCIFCGIDDETLQFRAKSSNNTLEMLDNLAKRYHITSFRFSDYILPLKYFQSLLPALADRPIRYHLECETKSKLSPERLTLMASAGFHECQPGIESFSSSVLTKMRKGVTAIRNVQTLVQGRMLGIRMHYNFLFGFPDDELDEYRAMLTLVPLLYHLDPPHGRQEIEITRYAPIQVDPARFSIEPGPPKRFYDVIFSPAFLARTGFSLDAYAYYFERTFWASPALERVYELLVTQIDHWKTLHATREVELTWASDATGEITFHDSRYSENTERVTLDASCRATFAACAGIARPFIDIVVVSGLEDTEVERALEILVNARVVYREGHRYLGLATPRSAQSKAERFQRLWVTA